MSGYNRYDKMQWLRETCTEHFIAEEFIDQLVLWLGEDDFEKFYDKLCSDWEIKRDPNDPKYDEETDSLDN